MDREKVIKGLRICSQDSICDGCPYIECCSWDAVQLLRDAFALLKEQEAVEPINSYGTLRCGNCRNIVGYNDGHWRGYQNNFCSNCGKAVKWG